MRAAAAAGRTGLRRRTGQRRPGRPDRTGRQHARDEPVKRKTLVLNSVLAVSAVGLVAFGVTSLGTQGSASATETETTVRTGNVTADGVGDGQRGRCRGPDVELRRAEARSPRSTSPPGRPSRKGQVLARDRQHDGRRTSCTTAQANLASAQARMQGLLHPLTAQDLDQEPGVGRSGAGRGRHRPDGARQREREPRAGQDHAPKQRSTRRSSPSRTRKLCQRQEARAPVRASSRRGRRSRKPCRTWRSATSSRRPMATPR